MAYLLDFLPSKLPDDIRAPPYVIFGIRGTSAVEHLPKRIPLKTVLHFAPTLEKWVLPAPENLPPAIAKEALRTPYVGIDIGLDIGVASLQRIVFKVMQAAGFAVPKNLFQHAPSLITSISILRTWKMLELPRAGLAGLLIHMQTRLILGPPVSFIEMRELWVEFPETYDILRLMAINFVQSHVALFYGRDEFESIRHWYLSCPKRYKIFKAAEDLFPELGKAPTGYRYSVRELINTNPVEARRKAKEQLDLATATQEAATRKLKLLEKKRESKAQKKMSMDDMKKRKDESTIRKSTKWKSAPELKEQMDLDGMTFQLTEMLLRVEKEREAEDESKDDDEREADSESNDDGETETYLYPTVYDPSAKTP